MPVFVGEERALPNSSWQYCYDAAGNLTSQDVEPGRPRGITYTYDDASELTSKNGSTTNWSYDKTGHAGAHPGAQPWQDGLMLIRKGDAA